MMGGVSPETCWASYKYEIKFWYTVAFCWIFFVNYTKMHGSTNVMWLGVVCRRLAGPMFWVLGVRAATGRLFKYWPGNFMEPWNEGGRVVLLTVYGARLLSVFNLPIYSPTHVINSRALSGIQTILRRFKCALVPAEQTAVVGFS